MTKLGRPSAVREIKAQVLLKGQAVGDDIREFRRVEGSEDIVNVYFWGRVEQVYQETTWKEFE